MSQGYKLRYHIEKWGKEPEGTKKHTNLPGIVLIDRPEGTLDYGYTDQLFLVSIIKDGLGNIESVLLMDSEDGVKPKRELLELIKEQIEHHLEHHCNE